MSRMLAVAALGLTLFVIEPVRVVSVQAAAQSGARPATAQPTSKVIAAPVHAPDRALLDQYCVSCHNDRLKTAGLSLEKVDVGDARGNAQAALALNADRLKRNGVIGPTKQHVAAKSDAD